MIMAEQKIYFNEEVWGLIINNIGTPRYLINDHMLFTDDEVMKLVRLAHGAEDFDKEVEKIKKNTKGGHINIFGIEEKRSKKQNVDHEISNYVGELLGGLIGDGY